MPTRTPSSTLRRRLALMSLVAVACGTASALDRQRALSQLHHTAWRATDGAPSQISALAQTDDGYLWIGSARGLVRFDGVQFESYAPPPGVSLPSHNIYALMATPDGGLWISFRPSGLGFLRDGVMTVYARPEELPRSEVYAFERDHDGRIWAGTHAGLALRDGSRWVEVGADRGFPPQRVRTLLVDRQGTLWVVTDRSVFCLPRGARNFQPTAAQVDVVPRIAQANDGRLWMAETSRRGLRPVPLRASDRRGKEPQVAVPAQELLFDRDGCLWVTDVHGVYRIRFPERLAARAYGRGDPEVEAFGERDGLSGDLANKLLEDREGNVWVSTAKGLDRFRHSHLVPVRLPPGHQRLTLLAGDEADVWAGSATASHLLRIRGQARTAHREISDVSSVYRDARGGVWWGTSHGLWRRENGRFESFGQPRGTKSDWLWEVTRGPSGAGLWVSVGDEGLFHFDGGRWTNRKPPPGLPDRGPSATYDDKRGRVWLGYTEDRVCVTDVSKGAPVRCYSRQDGLEIGRIRVIRGRGPHLWIGGELGLALFREGRFHKVRVAGDEPFGTVSGIVEASNGDLWLNEVNGIVRIAASETRRTLADPAHAVTLQRFGFLDGLPGGPQMNWTSSTAIEAGDGRLWFATDDGLAWIDPAHMARNEVPPPVAVRFIGVGDERRAGERTVALAVGTRALEIAYTALSLSIPERVRFRYRLEGVDEGWQEAGSRRAAHYTNLGPGRYRFTVKACNNDGVWNESGATLELTIPPAFHQTWWFLALSVLLAASGARGLYLLRLRQVAARMQALHDERLDERMRIAQELHDTLLQGLTSASMQLHVAAEALPADSPSKPLVSRTLALMRQMADEGRNVLRSLRPSDASEPPELEQAFARVKQDVAGAESIGLRIGVSGRPRALDPLVRDEVYRIGREALVNAFRHSGAQSVDLELEYLDRHLRVLVRDDGRGIDPALLQAGRENHWGIPGMRERAERIGAQLEVASRAGHGTEVELCVPARSAFRFSARGTAWERLSRLFARVGRRTGPPTG